MIDTDLAYMAGLVDGEGCVGVHLRKRGDMLTVLNVANTDPNLMSWIQERFGGRIYIHKRHKDKPRWKVCLSWRVVNLQARSILKVLIPFLTIKKERAELAIGASSLHGVRGRGRKVSNMSARIALAKTFRELNRTGASIN